MCEPFLLKKATHWFSALIDWVKKKKRTAALDSVIQTIQLDTIAYAKRQVTFWQSFSGQLQKSEAFTINKCLLQTINTIENSCGMNMANQLRSFLVANQLAPFGLNCFCLAIAINSLPYLYIYCRNGTIGEDWKSFNRVCFCSLFLKEENAIASMLVVMFIATESNNRNIPQTY
jgi:hypothetical protein